MDPHPIRTPFLSQAGAPIQPTASPETSGQVVLHADYWQALSDLDGFDWIWLLFHLDRSGPWKPRLIPYRDDTERGLFATRAPSRPNPIGISCVRLIAVNKGVLEVQGVDMLDNTPLIDIKPYVPEFDAHPNARAGWLDQGNDCSRADERFQHF